jgi:hypothetical protein
MPLYFALGRRNRAIRSRGMSQSCNGMGHWLESRRLPPKGALWDSTSFRARNKNMSHVPGGQKTVSMVATWAIALMPMRSRQSFQGKRRGCESWIDAKISYMIVACDHMALTCPLPWKPSIKPQSISPALSLGCGSRLYPRSAVRACVSTSDPKLCSLPTGNC